jgi:UDP-N-acetylmuramyl pentapeptide phosphotransferase/UDP-N-acetylglucosamine-1-phosphate transferase
MGGGLFGTPLALNPKCLVFSAFMIGVYFMPHPKAFTHNLVMAFVLATAAYVLLAWYDVIYECNDRLKPTLLGWISMPFKPAHYAEDYEKLPLKYQKVIRTFDIVVLVILLGLLVYPYIAFRR